MSVNEPVVELNDVTILREGRPILDSVSLTIHRGEHWAVLGPNGCGKTTLLNLVTGYLWPSSGSVTVLGDRYGDVDIREKRRHIGIVSSALFERVPSNERFLDIILSGKFASLGIYDESTDADHDRAMEIVSFLGREAIIDRPYRVQSFGERQSALIGRALMANPSILILDEPYEGLDMATREHLMTRIDSLMSDSDGPTVIFVSHRVEEISPGVTHAGLLRNGRLVSHGVKNEVLTATALQATFGIAVDLVHQNGRVYVHFL